MKYYVYKIEIQHLIYYGRTINLDDRLQQHISACYNPKNKAYNKQFYQEVRKVYPNKESGLNALKNGFKLIFICDTKADSKKAEMWLILERWINQKPLYQNIPQIKDF